MTWRIKLAQAIFIMAFSPLLASYEVCILNFERHSHPITKTINQNIDNENTLIFNEAKPYNLIDCIENNSTEIVFISHTLKMGTNNNKHVNFAYYSRLPHNNDTDKIHYTAKPILPQIFRKADYVLSQQETIHLKRIRFLSCATENILKKNSALYELLHKYNIMIDIAPSQVLGSVLTGEKIRVLDKLWLLESFQFPTTSSNENDFFYAYMKLNTIGAYRTGKGTALRGKYKIKLRGVALGFSSKWRTVFIPYSKLENMTIGEKRILNLFHLDFSVSFLWFNLGANISEKPDIQFPSEINSIGASLGLYARIEVERKY